MTTEIEKKFFDAFGIKHKCSNNQESTCPAKDCNSCMYNVEPTITDRILLELICIVNKFSYTYSETIDELREETLEILINSQEILSEEKSLFTMTPWARKDREKDKHETYTKVRKVFGLKGEVKQVLEIINEVKDVKK